MGDGEGQQTDIFRYGLLDKTQDVQRNFIANRQQFKNYNCDPSIAQDILLLKMHTLFV